MRRKFRIVRGARPTEVISTPPAPAVAPQPAAPPGPGPKRPTAVWQDADVAKVGQSSCGFRHELASGRSVRCARPIWDKADGGYCLYHALRNGSTVDAARQVWCDARRRAKAGNADFTGWHFPPDPDGLCFADQAFLGLASFKYAQFEGDVCFSGACFERGVWFESAVFHGRARFGKMTVLGKAWFDGAEFQDEVDFARAQFADGASFRTAVFRGPTALTEAFFRLDVNLRECKFWSDLSLAGAHVGHRLDMTGATFAGVADLDRALIEEGGDVLIDLPSPDVPFRKAYPFAHREQGAGAYRLARDTALAADDRARARQFHYAEHCAVEYGHRVQYNWAGLLRLWNPRWLWGFAKAFFEYGVGRLVFGFGDKPARAVALATALAVAVVCTGFYQFGLTAQAAVSAVDPTPSVGRDGLARALSCTAVLRDGAGGAVAVLNGQPVHTASRFRVEVAGVAQDFELAEVTYRPAEIRVLHVASGKSFRLPCRAGSPPPPRAASSGRP